MVSSEKNTLREMPQTFIAAPQGTEPRLAAAKPHRVKVFKSGNSLALRLPKALGLQEGMEMELTAMPDGNYTLEPVKAPEATLDISSFWGKAKGMIHVPVPREDFDERPSTLAKR
jgi:antitoxin VapB